MAWKAEHGKEAKCSNTCGKIAALFMVHLLDGRYLIAFRKTYQISEKMVAGATLPNNFSSI